MNHKSIFLCLNLETYLLLTLGSSIFKEEFNKNVFYTKQTSSDQTPLVG